MEVWVSKRATIIDVARAAGVAVSTASAALNGRPGVAPETRERVEKAAAEVNWVASVRGRSLSAQRSNTVGLVLQRSAFVLESDPFFSGLLGGIESVLEDSPFALVLQIAATAERASERTRQLVLSGAVDGLFVADVHVDEPRFAEVVDLDVPAVVIGSEGTSGHHSDPERRVCTVVQNQNPALEELVEHVVAQGHRHIAHVGGEPGMVHTREREGAWRRVLERHGLQPGPVVPGHFTLACGANAVDPVFAQDPHTTAVVCANDLMAMGFMARCQERGIRVPDQISVTGFDGIQWGAHTAPALTTVTTDPAGLGRAAATSLLSRIEGGAGLPGRDRSGLPDRPPLGGRPSNWAALSSLDGRAGRALSDVTPG